MSTSTEYPRGWKLLVGEWLRSLKAQNKADSTIRIYSVTCGNAEPEGRGDCVAEGGHHGASTNRSWWSMLISSSSMRASTSTWPWRWIRASASVVVTTREAVRVHRCTTRKVASYTDDMPAAASGRTERGLNRRRALLEATLRIVVRDGPAAVTHRSVANEAGATHGSVKYYFGGRGDMLREALQSVSDDNIRWLAQAQRRLVDCADDIAEFAAALTDLVWTQLIEDRPMGLSVLELHLAAARDPELRPFIRDWGSAYAAASAESLKLIGSQDTVRDTRFLAQLINGMVLEQLAVERPGFRDGVLRPNLERALMMIAAGAPAARRSSG